MKTSKLFAFVFLVAFSFACEKSENRNPLDFQLGQSFELDFDETGHCTCCNLSVHFADVLEDSRCPSDVECVWEGQARVQLNLDLAEGRDTIELTWRAGHGELASDTVDNFIFELLDVAPYPVSTETIEKEDYQIELKVTAL
ncbi:MAG: hypothetical protein J5I98_25135 [Phaeodactylibacter sp.]|nr:hypothetical protein [Phaeodactylibacter sp.]